MTQKWFNKQGLLPVQDRKDNKDYWRTDNLYTETEVLKLLKYYSQDMQKNKNNIIDDWLEKYNDPQIEQEVKSKIRNEMLEHFEKELEKLKNKEKELHQEINKLNKI